MTSQNGSEDDLFPNFNPLPKVRKSAFWGVEKLYDKQRKILDKAIAKEGAQEHAEHLQRLKLTEITLLPLVFQHRNRIELRDRTGVVDLEVAHRIAEGIKNGSRQDPLIIWEVGGKKFLVDGHHRYHAMYVLLDGQEPNNCECIVHTGWSLSEALAVAGEENSRSYVQMTPQERRDGMVREKLAGDDVRISNRRPKPSNPDLAGRWNVGRSTCEEANRRIRNNFPENPWESLYGMSYDDLKGSRYEPREAPQDTYVEAIRETLKGVLPKGRKATEIVTEYIREDWPSVVQRLTDEYLGDLEEELEAVCDELEATRRRLEVAEGKPRESSG